MLILQKGVRKSSVLLKRRADDHFSRAVVPGTIITIIIERFCTRYHFYVLYMFYDMHPPLRIHITTAAAAVLLLYNIPGTGMHQIHNNMPSCINAELFRTAGTEAHDAHLQRLSYCMVLLGTVVARK